MCEWKWISVPSLDTTWAILSRLSCRMSICEACIAASSLAGSASCWASHASAWRARGAVNKARVAAMCEGVRIPVCNEQNYR